MQEKYDIITGLYYLRARYYDPAKGRFTQEDAYWGDGLNLYVYVSNNPVKYVDPSGYCKGTGNKRLTQDTIPRQTPNSLENQKQTNIVNSKKGNVNSLPPTGEPNSTGILYNPDGSIKQERKYGPDGRAEKDIDYNHGGNEKDHEFSHEHEWDWSKNPPRQPGKVIPTPCPVPTPKPDSNMGNNPNKNSSVVENIEETAVWVGIGTILYWVISEASRILIPPRNLIPVP